MANVARVNGLRPVRYFGGAKYNAQANMYAVRAADSTALAVGDVVKLDGGADAQGVPSVTRMANGSTDAPLGVVVGLVIDPTNLNTPQYRVASTLRYVMVADDPQLVFEANCSGTAAYNADSGLNVGISLGAGVSTTTGASSMQVDLSTKATTNSLPFKIFGFSQKADMDYSDTSNAKVLVLMNNHQRAAGVTGV
jgi:hypothetical protein